MVKVRGIKDKLQAVSEKLLYTGAVRSQYQRGPGGKPEILIVRSGDSGAIKMVANEDVELQPGDFVDISLKFDLGAVETPISIQ